MQEHWRDVHRTHAEYSGISVPNNLFYVREILNRQGEYHYVNVWRAESAELRFPRNSDYIFVVVDNLCEYDRCARLLSVCHLLAFVQHTKDSCEFM